MTDKELKDLQLNKPIIESATDTEMERFAIKQNRDRYIELPDRLPTNNMMPLPPDEHKHIGLYENKQNLYLLIANVYNKLMERIEQLESK